MVITIVVIIEVMALMLVVANCRGDDGGGYNGEMAIRTVPQNDHKKQTIPLTFPNNQHIHRTTTTALCPNKY